MKDFIIEVTGPHNYKTGKWYGYISKQIVITACDNEEAINKVISLIEYGSEFFKKHFGGYILLLGRVEDNIFERIFHKGFNYGGDKK